MNLRDFELMVEFLKQQYGQYMTADDLVREFKRREQQAEKDLANARGYYGDNSGDYYGSIG